MKNYNKGEKVSIKRCYEVHINGYITDVCPGEVGTVRWDCGDTVEVYFGDYIMLEVNKEDIEPCISEETEEVTIDGWVARDEDGFISLFNDKPTRDYCDKNDIPYGFWDEANGHHLELPITSFPSLTWQSDPLEVTVTVKPKKQSSTE